MSRPGELGLKPVEVKWPVVSLKGGPHGRKAIATIDGEPIDRCHRIEITADVNDVIRVKTFTFAMADIEVETLGFEKGYIIEVREVVGDDPGGMMTLVQGRGRTILEALEDAVSTLKATEAAERLS